MRNNTEMLLPILSQTMGSVRDRGLRYVRTIDVIRSIKGQFLSDRNTPVAKSWNAALGRALAANAALLNIVPVETVKVSDDSGRPTMCKVWKLL